jgi:hypothetical protein
MAVDCLYVQELVAEEYERKKKNLSERNEVLGEENAQVWCSALLLPTVDY